MNEISQRNALIGHTGFVGSTLMRSMGFAETYNSKNIPDISGQVFDDVICAGVSAVKWKANKEPEADMAAIQMLMDRLETVKAKRFVLISTVDVYSYPVGVTESDEPLIENAQPYSRHRRLLEEWVLRKFAQAVIVRLPGLFGEGLKKNVIYDLLQNNLTENIVPNASFQWYPMQRLSRDLARILESNVKLINVAVEPVVTSQIVERFFPDAVIGNAQSSAPSYDVWTDKSGVLGGTGRYHISQSEVFSALSDFVDTQRK